MGVGCVVMVVVIACWWWWWWRWWWWWWCWWWSHREVLYTPVILRNLPTPGLVFPLYILLITYLPMFFISFSHIFLHPTFSFLFISCIFIYFSHLFLQRTYIFFLSSIFLHVHLHFVYLLFLEDIALFSSSTDRQETGSHLVSNQSLPSATLSHFLTWKQEMNSTLKATHQTLPVNLRSCHLHGNFSSLFSFLWFYPLHYLLVTKSQRHRNNFKVIRVN